MNYSISMELKKSLVIVISLMLALTFLNLLQDTYTGNVTSSYSSQKFKGSITITPIIALQDEKITINIKGPYYINDKKVKVYGEMSNKVYFYKDGLRKDEIKICTSSRCKGEFTKEFTIPAKMYSESKWLEGIYTTKVYDYLNKEYMETNFIVTNKSDSRIGCKEIDDTGNDPYHTSETTSYHTGKKIDKKDVCETDKILNEYYCCKNTDKNYKNELGICQIEIKCSNKCIKGACFS